MSRAVSNARRLWIYRIGLCALLAVGTHWLVVWATPRVIMHRVLTRVVPAGSGGVFLPPMTDHTQRRIVMPSPDLLYALCAYDLSERALRVRADPRTPNYWSIALYASNADNYFVFNDRQAAGTAIDWVLVGPGGYARTPAIPEGARLVTAPDARGLLLMRVLVGDHAAERARVEAARRSLRCEPL